MLHLDKLISALQSKRTRFRDAERLAVADLERLIEALKHFAKQSQIQIDFAIMGIPYPGAHPTIEQDEQPLVIPFGHRWQNHREARQWALQRLRGVTTFAADGSQISRTSDISIPVGVVQIGWFENRHRDNGQGDYVKDVLIEVLAPDELAGEESRFADKEVEWRRFKGEVAQAERFMKEHADDPAGALAFFDGSLIVSFVSQMLPQRQRDYVGEIERLLDVSEQTGVPLVGYVDTSHADDLTSLVAQFNQLGTRGAVSDAELLRTQITGWGDRCRLYECARDDGVLPVDGHKYYSQVHFTYLQTTGNKPPARIELPAWVLKRGLHDWVFDIIRAECVVGTGYPYTLESADAVAVLTSQDRERFLALFQKFAQDEGLPLWFGKKMISKRGRRGH